ncbi:Ig-like domain-containing protein [Dokdonia sp. Hel_I_63]|uniref:Ig-like domain-containing protein n=1 Tax=Dokdonia sp. Hel_I_63 TaxID=1249996 RepID=UPI00164823B7|nr:Ig-like domain-containing protein [Dokdonia sp. Hel_I_63]
MLLLIGSFSVLGTFEMHSQVIGQQEASITQGVTFQWEDDQDVNGDNDIDNTENNRSATIQSITVGNDVFNTFVAPSGYQLTRLGGNGNIAARHSRNGIVLNRTTPPFSGEVIGTSASATFDPTDTGSAWDNAALAAFQDKNLNHYFTSNGNGQNICGNFSGVVDTGNAQKQTLFYNPPIPSNQDGIIAITERGGNNCFYIRFYGTKLGSNTETILGDTFVRTSGDLRGGDGPNPPAPGSDYWESDREIENSQSIAIALFELNSVAPTGSKITRVEFVAASLDDGDGKLFILQKYAVDQLEIGCLNEKFEGNIDLSNNVPQGSTYSVVSGPSPAGEAFNLNSNGTFSYTPPAGYTGSVVFEYQVCLPAPNSSVCDTAFVTLDYVSPPEAAIIDLDCNSNGTTNLIVTSPLGNNLEYSINNGPFQSDTTFSNLSEGSYVVTVRDKNTGCSQASVSGFVIENLEVAIPIDVADVSCFGGNDGAINLEPSGGKAPYEFEWSNGATTEDLSGLSAGTYTVVVTDAYGCELEATAVVSGPAKAVSIKPNTVITAVSCFEGNDGAINITPDGGTPPYTYVWSNGATTQDISNLEAGSYTVTVIDANNCEAESTFSVEQPTAALSITDTITNVLCNGDDSGAVQLTVSGGTAPYTYEWSDGSTTAHLEDVTAGSYSVVVRDANDCEIQESFTITEPDSPLSINLTRENATTAQNCADGTAIAAVTGGTAPYTYLWSNGATVATISNLADGTYSVTVKDANGCEITQSVVVDCINTCDAVIAIGTVRDVLCAGEETGSTTVSASSEANPDALFTFTWSNGDVDAGVTSSTLDNIGAGVYTVSVTIDGTVCQPVEQSVTISEPSSAVGVTIVTEDETGPGLSNGEAKATATGGVAPYTYSWSTGATTAEINNLSPGDYTVEVTDANGCTVENTVTINPGSCNNLAITTGVEDVTCNGFSDGSIISTTTGGNGPFTYSWSNGATTENINNVTAGSYTVTVTDSFTNCTAQSTVTVNEPTVLSAGIAVNNVLCFGESTGSLNLTVSGGTPDYTYEWSGGQTIEDLTALPAGNYSVIVTDGNGCTTTAQAVISQPASAVTADVSSTNENGATANDGTATVLPEGGTMPYTILWSNGETTNTIDGLDAGDYAVVVTDANGCTYEETITVASTNQVPAPVNDSATTSEDTAVAINVTDNDSFGSDGPNDSVIVITEQPENGSVTVDDGGTPNDPTDDTVLYTPEPDFNGTDTFEYEITDSNGDSETATVTVVVTPVDDVVSDTSNTDEDVPVEIDVLGNDTFDENADVAITDVTDPANGTVEINDNGTVTYTPNPDFNGEDTFEYTVTVTNPDGTTTTETAIVTVTVSPIVDVADDAETTPEDTPVNVDVLGNDTFEGTNNEVTDVTDPANGTVVINDDGTVTYTPDPDFNGEDTFDYTVTVTNPDGTTTTETATVVVTVTPEQDVMDDAATTPEDTPVDIDVLENDGFDPAADVAVTDVTDPANGTVVINDDGTVTYTPDPDFNGEDTFDYTVTVTNPDGTTTTETATVVVTVTPEEDVMDDAATTPEDTPVDIDVLENDGFDPAADVAVTDVTDPANGTVVINDDGTVTYTPDPDFNGEDTFDYTVTVTNPDGTTTTETATVVVTVTPEEDVMDDAATTPEDTPVDIDVLENDGFDPAADVAVTDVTDPANGTVVINDDGTVTYTPDPDFNGEDTFDYTVTVTNPDGTTTTETATVVVTVTPEEDVMDDAATTPEDTPVDIDVLENDGFDPAADVAVTDVTDPANGTVVINDDGTVTYTPDPDFNGEDTFDYTVTVTNPDGTTTTETATVVVTVTPEQDVMDDAATTPEDTPVDIDVLENDGFDPAADVAVTDVTDPANGTVVINDDGTVTYTPDPDFNGEDTFDYTVTVTNPDGTTTTETATVVVTVTPEQDVMDDAATTPEDTPVDIDVLENDGFDPAADVAVTDVTDPANGTVVINDDGTVTYTPDPDFNGEDTFDYTVTVTNPDGTTTTETATVVVTVTPEEDVMDDAATTPEDTPVDIDVLENDGFDPAADVAVTDVTDPANGTVVINDDGTVTYTPDPDFNGEDTFDYTVTVTNPDGTTTTETATVVVTVTPEEDVMDDAATTPEDTPVDIDVLENDGFDPAADVAVTDVTDPANGTVVINDDGTVTYTPDPDFNGEDTFDYTVTVTNPDGTTTTETATVVVTVTPEEDVMDDAATTPEDTPVDIDVLENDGFDPAADVAVTDVTDPANGTVVINDDGTVTYTPDPDFNGEDTFDYTVTVTNPDGTTTTETATVVVTVTPEEDVMDDAATTPEDTPVDIDVLENDGFDPAADVAVTDVTDPANGTVVINDDGTVTYTPDPDFNGEDTFDYTVTVTNPDGTTTTETATVVVTVTPEEDVMDDAATTPEDTPVDIDVLENDGFDPAADVAVTDVTDPANGTVVINDDGTVTYTPDPDFNGEDTFDYTVTVTNPDGTTTTETATVVVTVTPEEDVMDDAATTPEDTPVDIDVLENDGFDPAADVAVTDVTDPANGTVVINDDGTVTYTPDPDFNGEDTFDYTVTVTNPDGTTTTETATVVVTVTPEQDVMDDAATTPEDTPVDIDVLENDGFDPAADVAVTDVTDPANGTVVINDDGTVTYTPDPDFNGEDTFDYTVTVTNPDGTTTTETATVVVTVTPEQDVMDDAATTPEDTPVDIDVLENDGFDPAADVAVTDVTDPANGTVVINDDGTVTYTPDPDFNGEDTFDYTVTVTNPDGTTTTETATVVVTVTPEEDVMDDAATTPEDTPVDIDVLENDGFDPAADVAVTDVTDPANGTVVINDDGTVTYTPDPDFNGEDTFDYTVTVTNPDGTTTTETATVVVTVTPEEDVMDDAATTPEDTPVDIDVLENDGFDPAADVAVTDVTDPANGTVVINDDGTVTYTPDPDFNGEDTFDYTVTVTNPDGTTTTETATVVVTVTPEEDVMDDAATTPEDTPVDIDVLENDGFDPAADVAVTDVTDPANGTVVINDDGTVTYTPDPDFNGEDTFDYTVTVTNPDGTTTTETATVVVTVTPEQDVMDDAATTPEDTPVDIDVLENDGFDPAADVAVTDVTDPANGTVVINDDGTVTYTPDPDFNGEDTFDYTVTVTNPDGTTTTETATVVVTVTPEQDVMDDAATTPEDTPVDIDVLENDGFDPAADVAVTDVTDPANGTVVINDDGTVTYTPDPDFNGEDTFDYTVTVTNPDGTTTTETATVVVTVTPEEDVMDDAATTPEDTPVDIDVLENDGFDPAADVAVTDVTDPANGTVVINDDGTVTYTPDPDFNGEDTFDYTVTVTNPDGTTTTETATVVVTVTPEEDVMDDAATTPEDTPVDIDVLENDGFDPAADVAVTDVTDPANGTVVINDDGTVTYTPDPDFNGEDTFDYTVTVTNPDGTTTTETATVVVTVTPEEDVMDDAATTPEDTPVDIDVLENDGFDPAADVAVTDVTDPANGTVVINDDGTVTYTPDPNFNGEDTFDYTVTVTNPDGTTTTETATVVVTVTPDNPSLDLFKEGNYEDTNEDGVVNLGDSIIYNFIVFNNGDVPLSNITLTDELVEVMGGPIDLEVGESDSMTFTAIYAITQDDINAGAVYNQAIATGEDPAGELATDASEDPTGIDPNNPLNDPDCMECTITVLNQDPEIAIVKTGLFNDQNGDGFAQAGETITYNFSVTNTGNVTVTNIVVTDPLVTVTGGPIDLVPGTSDDTTFLAEYVLTQEDVDAGLVENQALATGQDPNGDDVVDTSDDNSTIEGEEDVTITDLPEDPGMIAIVKTGTFNDEDGDGFAQAGETITYNFTVTNTGNVTVTNIVVTDPLVTVTGGPIDLAPDAIDATTFVAQYVLTQEDVDAGMVENQALATGQNPNGDDVVDTSDDDSSVEGEEDVTVTDLPEDPGMIAIVKTGTFNDEDGDGFAQAGETITYNFTITNTGNVTVTNIVVTDPLVTVTGGPIDLAPDAIDATTFVAQYVLTQEDVDAGMVENQALATGQNPNGDDVVDTSDDDSSVEGEEDVTVTDLPEDPGMIAIVKTGTFNDEDGDGFAQAGETITYNFTITNTGNVTVTNIVVTDPLVTVTGGPIDLAPDAIDATTFVAQYVLTQEDVDAGMVENQALATGQNPNGEDVVDTSDDDSSVEGEEDVTVTDLPEDPGMIAIVKTGTFNDEDGDGFAQAGETITYNFTVTNTGNVTVTNIVVTDPLVTVTGGPIDLAPDAIDATTFVAQYVLTQEDVDAGMVENQALATGQNPNGDDVVDTSDDDSSVEGEEDVTVTDLPEDPGMIAIVKTGTFNDEDGDGFAQAGETITYNFTITNTGNVTVTNIVVTDPLVTVTGGPIDLNAGASDATTFSAIYTITQADIDNGGVTNQALATGQNPDGDDVTDTSDDDSNLEDDETITTFPTDEGAIALIKTGFFNDESGDGFAQVGETVTYNFTVTNTGNITITNIVINDPLVTVTGGPIDLSAGEVDTDTFSAVYTLTQADVDAGGVTNQAVVTGQNPDGNDVLDTSDDDSNLEDDITVTDLPQGASISLIKTAVFNDVDGDGFAQVGETITYNFIVTNTGNVTVTNIIIEDPLVNVTGGPIDLDPGETDSTTFVAIYTIVQSDIALGYVTNQAIATGQDPDGIDVVDISDDNNSVEDDETVTNLPIKSSIALEKVGTTVDIDGDGLIQDGEVIQYTFTVTNTGSLPLNNISITDPLVTVDGGPISLLPGESDSTTFTATYVVTPLDIANGFVLNQAVVNSIDSNGLDVTDLSDDPNNDENVDPNMDGNPDDPTLTTFEGVLNIFDLEVFNGISPDGDGINDFFIIEGIDAFPENNVQIFNRWGVQVFEQDGYTNSPTTGFKGISEGRATISADNLLPAGTYFYLISYQTPDGLRRKSGYLYINR